MADNSRSEASRRGWTPERRAALAQKMKREGNPNWKGGRSVASNGYVLVKVGTDHPMADVRGYAYEHRLVAAEKLGRPLQPGEQAHHADENKQNNAPDNIEPEPSIAHHRAKHRKRSDLRMPGEPNQRVQCACGCGAEFHKYDADGRPRRFVTGHNVTRNERGQWENRRG